jgi:hypothetical protein
MIFKQRILRQDGLHIAFVYYSRQRCVTIASNQATQKY